MSMRQCLSDEDDHEQETTGGAAFSAAVDQQDLGPPPLKGTTVSYNVPFTLRKAANLLHEIVIAAM